MIDMEMFDRIGTEVDNVFFKLQENKFDDEDILGFSKLFTAKIEHLMEITDNGDYDEVGDDEDDAKDAEEETPV